MNSIFFLENPLCVFRDASYGWAEYSISILDCLHALDKALKFNFFDINDFDVDEYEHYEVNHFVIFNLSFIF